MATLQEYQQAEKILARMGTGKPIRYEANSVVGRLVNRAIKNRVEFERSLQEQLRKGLLEDKPESKAVAEEIDAYIIAKRKREAEEEKRELKEIELLTEQEKVRLNEEFERRKEQAETKNFFGFDIPPVREKISGLGEFGQERISELGQSAIEFFIPGIKGERVKTEREQEIIRLEGEYLSGRISEFESTYGFEPLSEEKFEKAMTEKETIERQIGAVQSHQQSFAQRQQRKEQELIEKQFEEPSLIVSGFVKGAVSSPFDVASFGVGLATSPISTGKETILSFKELPSLIKAKPVSTISELSGNIAGQSLIFSGFGKGFKAIKQKVPKISEVNFIDSALTKKTSLSNTFAEGIRVFEGKNILADFEIIPKQQSLLGLETFKRTGRISRAKESLFSGLEGERIISSFKKAFQQEPRIKALKQFKKARAKEPKLLTFEFEKPLVQRFDIIDIFKKQKAKEPITFGLDVDFLKQLRQQPKRYDTLDLLPKKAKGKPKKPKPLTFEFEKPLVQRYDTIETSYAKPQLQLLLKKPKLKKPKQKVIQIYDILEQQKPRIKFKTKLKQKQIQKQSSRQLFKEEPLQKTFQIQRQTSGLLPLLVPQFKPRQAQKQFQFQLLKQPQKTKQALKQPQLFKFKQPSALAQLSSLNELQGISELFREKTKQFQKLETLKPRKPKLLRKDDFGLGKDMFSTRLDRTFKRTPSLGAVILKDFKIKTPKFSKAKEQSGLFERAYTGKVQLPNLMGKVTKKRRKKK